MIVKLKPALKSYLWGGKNLKREWNKTGAEDKLSEAWELSFHKDGPSVIADGKFAGKLLSDVATRSDWGANCDGFEFFPVLNKIIDAAEPLSIQVHPSDEYALENEGQYGKTEMWHILSAKPGAFIYLGFNRDMTKEEFAEAINNNTICDYLNKVPVLAGETYFIPSGTIHAIGAGITIYEIQQNSSLTYRVYDFDRKDKDGNKRELHIEKAIAVADLKAKKVPDAYKDALLGKCKYFSVYRYRCERRIGRKDSFVCVTVIDGSVKLGDITLKKGETAFLSAGESVVARGGGLYILTCVE